MNIKQEIAALAKMGVAQLRRRHAELFGEENRSGNRQYLFRRIAWRAQAKAEGDLSERARRRAEQLARDQDIRMNPPRDTAMPGAPTSLPTATGTLDAPRDERLPVVGAMLTRVYKDRQYRVIVQPNGFEYSGKAYRSLSAVAYAITGCHWNGYHFFGLIRKRKEQPRT